MTHPENQPPSHGQNTDLTRVYKRHVQGAWVRSGASVLMWLCAWLAYYVDDIHGESFLGISFSVLFLILFNIPTVFILKQIRNKKLFGYFSLLINILEIVGYTFIMHFVGGIEATYLLSIYAALIVYVGVVGPRRLPFIIAFFCVIGFSLMVFLEHLAILQDYGLNTPGIIGWQRQIIILLVNAGMMFVVAFISSYTAHLLRKNRNRLRSRNEELKVALRKANESDLLREALRRASESDRLKSEFLANMSHELRTPLNAIIGFSELLGLQYPEKLDGNQHEFVKNIHSSGQHLLAIISGILDLSKIEAGRLLLDKTDIGLPLLLANSLDLFREGAMKHRLRLALDIGDCPETIHADELRLRQILYNLLSNAVKFTPDGGSVTLSARLLTRHEGRWLTRQGDAVMLPARDGRREMTHERIADIAVADTGIGVRQADRERIFKPFVQGDGSMSRRYDGTGLGLALTERFAELHGGYLFLESDGENRGSTFHCVIPV